MKVLGGLNVAEIKKEEVKGVVKEIGGLYSAGFH